MLSGGLLLLGAGAAVALGRLVPPTFMGSRPSVSTPEGPGFTPAEPPAALPPSAGAGTSTLAPASALTPAIPATTAASGAQPGTPGTPGRTPDTAPSAGAVPPSSPGAGAPGELRYRWAGRSQWSYQVKIEAEGEDAIETLTGHAFYAVRSTGPDRITLGWGGSLFPSQRPKPGAFPRPGVPPVPLHLGRFWHAATAPPFGRGNEVEIDPYGRVLRTTGELALPRALGDLSLLVIDPLPQPGLGSWEAVNDCTLSVPEVRAFSPYSPFGRGETTRYPARERSIYRLVGRTGSLAQFTREYDLRTTQQTSAGPRFQMTGSGTTRFDTQAGAPVSMEFSGILVSNEDTVTRRVPLRVSYQVAAPAAPGGPGALTPPPARPSASRPPSVPAAQTPEPLTRNELDQLLSDLRAADGFRVRNACNRLARARADERREDVSRGLVDLLDDRDGFTRQAAAKALQNWATRGAVQVLIRGLDDRDFGYRWAVMETLGALKDPRAAEPLARLVAANQDRGQASRALQALGPVAERAVLRLLNDPDMWVRVEAARILKVIGTRSSIEPLRAATRGTDRLAAITAEEAIQAIQSR